MRLTLLTISTILLIACIYSLYNAAPSEMDVIFDEDIQIDTIIYDLDSIEEYDRMVMDSLDKEDMDWTGTTQGDSIN